MKNLFTISQEEKQRILEMHTSATKKNYIKESYHKNPRLINEATETLDSTVIKTGMAELNSLVKSIPVPEDENPFDEYITSGYFIDEGYIGSNEGQLEGNYSTDLDVYNPKTNIRTKQSAYDTALIIGKWNPDKVSSATLTSGGKAHEIVYVAGAPGAKSRNNIEKHIESYKKMVYESSLKPKEKTSAYSIVDQIKTKLTELTGNIQSIMDKIPKEDDYYGRFLQLTNGLELNLVDQDESNTPNQN